MEIDRKTLKALAADTRLDILKSLGKRRKTPSELSKELNLAASTIVEHLTKLEEAGLIRREETGHKWIYYNLTEKGSSLVKPRIPTNFVIVLSLCILAIFVGYVYYYTNYTSFAGASRPDMLTIPSSQKAGEESQRTAATGGNITNVTNTTQCISNNDCAIGGCSSQLCGKKGIIENIITTCEWKEEYACYRLTQCQCIQNKCQWNQTSEFIQCLANFTR